MKKDVESRWDDLRTAPIQKLCHYQLCSKHFEDSEFMNKETKNKLIWNAIPTLFDVPNSPSKVTPSWPIKARSMMSTMKKTSVESTEQPVDILQDLPSTLQQRQVCNTPQKKRLKWKIQALSTELWQKQQFIKPRKLECLVTLCHACLYCKVHVLHRAPKLAFYSILGLLNLWQPFWPTCNENTM